MNKIKFNIKSNLEILKIRSVRFSKYAEGKARLNLYYMLISSAAGLIISTLMLLPAPFFLAELSPNPARLVFYPVFLAAGIFSAIALKRGLSNSFLIRTMCVLMSALTLGAAILTGVFLSPDSPAVFYPLLIIMLSTAFVVRPIAMDLLTAVMTVLFIILSQRFKTPDIADYDTISATGALMMSWLASYFVYYTRMKDYAAQNELYKLSSTDSLTSLLNKRSGEYNSLRYMRSNGTNEAYTAMMLDLDDFKNVNDMYGHIQGDKILAAFGRELKRAFRSDDILSRTGGDEFFVLLRNIGDKDIIEQKAQSVLKICGVLNETFGTRLGVSMGIVIVPKESPRPLYEQLYKAADVLLYKSKRGGKNKYTISNYTDIKAKV